MDLYSGDPYWLIKNGFLSSYQKLTKDISTDIVIVGGGITAALMAYNLRKKTNVSITILEKRHVGLGSTCTSTALLQYEIDTSLTSLSKTIGIKNAQKIYSLCHKTITNLYKISRKLPVDCKFEFKKSLYMASTKKDIELLKQESKQRQNIRINADFLDSEDIKKLIGIDAYGALYSDTAAQLDPLLFTHGVFNYLQNKSVDIFDLTKVASIHETKNSVKLICENGSQVKCKKVIFANGYESLSFIKEKIAELNSTYAIISKPIDKKNITFSEMQIWETARPYLYIRCTQDNRIIIGGKDEKFYNPQKRDEFLQKKVKTLEKEFRKKFPAIEFQTDFSWTGTFADTPDGLPYIGRHKQYKHAYFALGFGGNGIVFAQIAGTIISDLILDKASSNAYLFQFNRL